MYINALPPKIFAYASRYEEWLPNFFKATEREEIHEACVNADHVIFGDFHTLKQSQRALSRLLYQIQNYYPERGVAVALECFYSKDQKHLDAYMDDLLSEKEFLKAINFQKSWGFPWQNYKRVLITCKNLGIKVYAINKVFKSNSLENRDNHAAEILEKIRVKNPNTTIFTLIGEYHLADEHLPKSIIEILKDSGKVLNIVRVVTNIDKYYFALRSNQKTHGSEYLDLGKNSYCIINTPPWIKWKSFTMWEEMKHIIDTIDDDEFDYDEIDEEDDIYTEIEFDVDSNFLNICFELLRFLEIDITDKWEKEIENFKIVYLNDFEDFIKESHLKLSLKKEREILEKCQKEGVVYLPEGRVVLVSDLNANHIAEAVGQHIFSISNPKPENLLKEQQLIYDALMYSAGLFTAKIFNPKRGFMILDNYVNFLSLNAKKTLIGRAKEKKVISKAILKFDQLLKQGPYTRLSHSVLLTDIVTYGGLTRAIGQVIGHQQFCEALEKHADELFLHKILIHPIIDKGDMVARFFDLWTRTPSPVKLIS